MTDLFEFIGQVLFSVSWIVICIMILIALVIAMAVLLVVGFFKRVWRLIRYGRF